MAEKQPDLKLLKELKRLCKKRGIKVEEITLYINSVPEAYGRVFSHE